MNRQDAKDAKSEYEERRAKSEERGPIGASSSGSWQGKEREPPGADREAGTGAKLDKTPTKFPI
ncbi:hypothetical protein ES703_04271 [subsurface metagenome]